LPCRGPLRCRFNCDSRAVASDPSCCTEYNMTSTMGWSSFFSMAGSKCSDRDPDPRPLCPGGRGHALPPAMRIKSDYRRAESGPHLIVGVWQTGHMGRARSHKVILKVVSEWHWLPYTGGSPKQLSLCGIRALTGATVGPLALGVHFNYERANRLGEHSVGSCRRSAL
jgi:hypothetical protein